MRGEKIVLRDVSLRIGVGEHVAILGPNGCGKSTLIKTIARECYPLVREGSRMAIFGQERWNIFDLRPLLGVVSNDWMALCTREITGREAVLSGFFGSVGVQSYHRITPEIERKTAAILALLEIPHLAERTVTEMSSGEARRVLLARALVHDPRALVLDERVLSDGGIGSRLERGAIVLVVATPNRAALLGEQSYYCTARRVILIVSVVPDETG